MERLSAAHRTLLALTLLTASHALVHAASLLENGDLTEGSGSAPAGWRHEAWNDEASRFGWEAEATHGTLAVANLLANDARWCQTVAVTPGGTYRISAEVKTENVGADTAGAFVSIEPRIGHSRLIDGTHDWQALQIELQATGPERQWDVCLRLGSNGSLNTGRAWFRKPAVVQVGANAPVARREPSLASRVALWVRHASWAGVLVPLGAGIVLAFGLGVLGRRPPPAA